MAEKKGAISRIQLSDASNGEYYVLRDEETRTKLQTDLQTLRTEIGTKVQSQRGIFSSTTDADPSKNNAVALIAGDPTDTHMELDPNEILAKKGSATQVDLALNPGGTVSVGNGSSSKITIGGQSISEPSTAKNLVWASPSDKAGRPTMRTLAVADIPKLSDAKISSVAASKITGTLATIHGGTGVDNTSITANTVFAGPNGSTGTAKFRKLAAADLPTITSGKIESLSVTKVSGLGTIEDQTGTASKPCVNNNWSQLPSISLTAGVWVIVGTITWAANSSGARGIVITNLNEANFRTAIKNHETTLPHADQHAVRVMANPTYCTIVTTTKIVSLGKATTIYLHGFQSSGAALDAISSHIQAVRIK